MQISKLAIGSLLISLSTQVNASTSVLGPAASNSRVLGQIAKFGSQHQGNSEISIHFCDEDYCANPGSIEGANFSTGDGLSCKYHGGYDRLVCLDSQNQAVDFILSTGKQAR